MPVHSEGIKPLSNGPTTLKYGFEEQNPGARQSGGPGIVSIRQERHQMPPFLAARHSSTLIGPHRCITGKEQGQKIVSGPRVNQNKGES
jgi:hypothetical protein